MFFCFARDAALYGGLINSIDPEPGESSPHWDCPKRVPPERIYIKARRQRDASEQKCSFDAQILF